jgi:membrane protein required for colicin V production
MLLKRIAEIVLLGWVDHLGGAIFGLVFGVIFFGALFTLWCKFFGTPNIIRESVLAGILLDRFPVVLALFPDEFDSIRSFFR